MAGAFGAALAKDLRLLGRDRVGLVFLTIAPIVVISVAGFSLSALYGGPTGGASLVLPLADEDHGWAGAALDVRVVPSRRAARALVHDKQASAALVVLAGTSKAIEAGRAARLVLYTDPVRSIELAEVRALVQELRHGLEGAARARAERELAAARDRLEIRLAELRGFLDELAASERAFAAWLAVVREKAGRFVDRVPPPPAPPGIPSELRALAGTDPDDVIAQLLPPEGKQPALPRGELPELPDLDLPTLATPPEPPLAHLPRALAIREASVTGAPGRPNTFDQNVPGFSITFLLLGVLLGVSLGFLDERDWGTLERLRTTPTPLAAVVLAKLSARAAVGMAQMLLLFAVGRAAFGVSLGPQPLALLLPTTGMVLAGTTFGLVIAALTRSREAVLPVGSIVILTMAAVGGCWWPIDLEPAWMRRLALAFPTTWAMEAYNDLMIRRRPAAAALPATGVLLAHAAVYLVVGLALFRRRVARGV